jgi:predicted amidophosphoribosyltransferase
VVRAALDDLVTTFYPSDCRACGRSLLRADLLSVCDYRIDSVETQSMTLCGRCGEALAIEGVRFAGKFRVERRLCSTCRMAPPEFERAVACAVCEDELREMVNLPRYQRMRTAAKPLGGFLARAEGSDWRSFGSANSS